MARSRFDGNDRVGPNPALTTLVRRTAAQWRSMRMRPTFLLLSCIGWATGSAQLPNRLERILSAHDIPQANVSVVVQALGAEQPVLAHCPLEPRNPGEFDGDSFRAYNVMPNAMLVNLKAIRYHFGIHPGGDGVLLTADPLPDTLEIVNRLRLVGGRCRG